MQPLFETSGWSLPKSITAKTGSGPTQHNSKPAPSVSQDTEKTINVSAEADLLQAQLSNLNETGSKKKSNKKRQLVKEEKGQQNKPNKKQKQHKQQVQKEKKAEQPPKGKSVPSKQQETSVTDNDGKHKKQKKQKLKELLSKSKQKQTQQQVTSATHNSKDISNTKPSAATLDDGLTPLQRKMKEKLSGARFRWLNEQLYTKPGDESFSLFQEKPELFDEYHEGFRHQVESWPVNPVDVIIEQLKKLPKKNTIIADLGCGDAMIAQTLKKQHYKVLSFDLIAKNEFVTACDISNLPLKANSVDVAVFSLSLMGTNYLDFVKEAYRILKVGGELKIAEVVSRFTDLDAFIKLLESLGFQFIEQDDDNKMFILLYFKKLGNNDSMKKNKKKAVIVDDSDKLQRKAQHLLKPCLYKKR